MRIRIRLITLRRIRMRIRILILIWCGSGIFFIRIRLFTSMRIRIWIFIWCGCGSMRIRINNTALTWIRIPDSKTMRKKIAFRRSKCFLIIGVGYGQIRDPPLKTRSPMVSFLRRRNFSTSEAVSRRPFGLKRHQSMKQQKKNWYDTKMTI